MIKDIVCEDVLRKTYAAYTVADQLQLDLTPGVVGDEAVSIVKEMVEQSDLPEEDKQQFIARLNEETEDKETEEDIEDIVDELSDDDLIDKLYGQDEIIIVKENFEPVELTEELNEIMSRVERLKAAQRFARSKTKRAMKMKLALHRRSSGDVLNRRARRAAIIAMKMKLAKKPLDQLSTAERERIEKIVAKRKKTIDRVALKMIPRIKKIESDRLSAK